MRSASLVLLMSLAPNTAQAIQLIPTGTVAGPLSLSVSGALFARGRTTFRKDEDEQTELALTRARIGVELRWEKLLRIQIEPDFAGGLADPADVFADITPLEDLGVLIGRAKVPFGALELENRWKLPSISRGLISDVLTDRRMFAGRRVGAKAHLRLKEVPLRPGIDVGAYRDSLAGDQGTDAAIRLEMRPYFKGSELSAAGYARHGASIDGAYGYAGSLAFTYDRDRFYLTVEGIVLRSQLLARAEPEPEVNATLTAGRLLVAYAFKWEGLRLQPFLGVEVLDPNARTRSDVGGAIRGGLNLIFKKVLRFGLEIDHQRGQQAFVAPDRTTVTLFVGVFLE